jgi:hypothetical protein
MNDLGQYNEKKREDLFKKCVPYMNNEGKKNKKKRKIIMYNIREFVKYSKFDLLKLDFHWRSSFFCDFFNNLIKVIKVLI